MQRIGASDRRRSVGAPIGGQGPPRRARARCQQALYSTPHCRNSLWACVVIRAPGKAGVKGAGAGPSPSSGWSARRRRDSCQRSGLSWCRSVAVRQITTVTATAKPAAASRPRFQPAWVATYPTRRIDAIRMAVRLPVARSAQLCSSSAAAGNHPPRRSTSRAVRTEVATSSMPRPLGKPNSALARGETDRSIDTVTVSCTSAIIDWRHPTTTSPVTNVSRSRAPIRRTTRAVRAAITTRSGTRTVSIVKPVRSRPTVTSQHISAANAVHSATSRRGHDRPAIIATTSSPSTTTRPSRRSLPSRQQSTRAQPAAYMPSRRRVARTLGGIFPRLPLLPRSPKSEDADRESHERCDVLHRLLDDVPERRAWFSRPR